MTSCRWPTYNKLNVNFGDVLSHNSLFGNFYPYLHLFFAYKCSFCDYIMVPDFCVFMGFCVCMCVCLSVCMFLVLFSFFILFVCFGLFWFVCFFIGLFVCWIGKAVGSVLEKKRKSWSKQSRWKNISSKNLLILLIEVLSGAKKIKILLSAFQA